MANTTIDTVSISKLRELISLKDLAYKEAIKNGETFEVVEKIHKEKKELEKELIRRETRST